MLPAVAYFDGLASDLRYAWSDGAQWQNVPIDTVTGCESWFGPASLAIDPDGEPAVSYTRWPAPSAPDVRLARFDGTSWNSTIVSATRGAETSLVFQTSGAAACTFADEVTFNDAAQLAPGDLHCDGAVDFGDINACIALLTA